MVLWSESFHCTCQNSEEVVVYSYQTKRFRPIYLFHYKFSLIIICYSIALINRLPPLFAPCSLIDLSTLSSLCNYICIRVKSVCNGLKPDWTKQIFPFLVTEPTITVGKKNPQKNSVTGVQGKGYSGTPSGLKTSLIFCTGDFGPSRLFMPAHPLAPRLGRDAGLHYIIFAVGTGTTPFNTTAYRARMGR